MCVADGTRLIVVVTGSTDQPDADSDGFEELLGVAGHTDAVVIVVVVAKVLDAGDGELAEHEGDDDYYKNDGTVHKK